MDEFERVVRRFVAQCYPYSGADLQGMLCDFEQLEEDGAKVLTYRRTGEHSSMIEIVVQADDNVMEVIEARWQRDLRLSKESVHTMAANALYFASRSGDTYVTGRVSLVSK